MPPNLKTAAMLREAMTLAQQERHPQKVLDICQRIVAAEPDNAEAHWLLAATYMKLGRNPEARRGAEVVMRLRPKDPRPYHQLAAILLQDGEFGEVDRMLDRGVSACGQNALFAALRAERLRIVADYEGAYQACKPLIDAGTDNPFVLVAAARACGRTDRLEEGIGLLQRHLTREDVPPATRAPLLCALADLFEAAKRYDEAFEAMTRSNAFRRPPLEPALQSAGIDRLIAAWDREALAALPRGEQTDLPVFIVGFWRSGTTLVEQTLSCHPRVFGAGELPTIRNFAVERHDPAVPSAEPLILDPRSLNRSAVSRISRSYLAQLRTLAPEALRVTDKLPVNFMHLGLISVLFPGARVVHCLRDPMDTCISCYFNLQGHTPYARSLRTLGSFYGDYLRLMAHWKSVVDIPILDIVYEDFVAQQEATARRLVEFVGLPWDEACLRHHENRRVAMSRSIDQVRQPMYTSSVARWRRYERHLGPLLEALGPDAAARP